jgi:SM-20-related protein
VTNHKPSQLQPLESIAEALATQGWSVTRNFIPADLVRQLGEEALELFEAGKLRAAGIGTGDRHRVDPAIRSDQTLWLDPSAASRAQRECLSAFDALRLTLNRELQLGLFELEAHFAAYPAGAFYRRHRDQQTGSSGRVVSCVLYLNSDWRDADGGQLRLYLDPKRSANYQDVLPEGGTLVCFMSERFWHEVLPATRVRLSLTGWFRRRGSG